MVPFGKHTRIFISHSHRDKAEVEQLLPFLNAANLPIWFDQYDIEVGESIVEGVQSGIEGSAFVVFWITRNFLESRWCKYEMNAFIKRLIEDNSRVISILGSDVSSRELPLFLRDIKYIERQDSSPEELSGMIVRAVKAAGRA